MGSSGEERKPGTASSRPPHCCVDED